MHMLYLGLSQRRTAIIEYLLLFGSLGTHAAPCEFVTQPPPAVLQSQMLSQLENERRTK